ncbi:hypothetical protein SLEP1_g6905 [Rubroshorea leprosula]|uniref:Uncharacterized protein n=1 Tax=Rubroshorea leprosula TaxID=152421 RepID=A0AAV5I2J4_9ROSI|nr:hypothetical protein SLEP1_g6905 [Rubroshorea leprosula]
MNLWINNACITILLTELCSFGPLLITWQSAILEPHVLLVAVLHIQIGSRSTWIALLWATQYLLVVEDFFVTHKGSG